MPQYELGFQDYWRILRRRKGIIIFAFLVIFLAVIIYLNLQTPIYKAVATIKIEQRRTLVGALMEYIAWSPGDPMVSEARVIESRLIAEEVAKRLGLVEEGATAEEFNKVVSGVHDSISTDRERGTNLINIIVLAPTPKRAAAIANEVAEVYLEHDLERKIKQARQVREFIEEQLATVEVNLKSSEEELRKLKEENPVTGIAVPLEGKVVALKTDLAELLVRATEKHPQVTRLKEQIKYLEDQLKILPEGELELARLTRDIDVSEKLYTTLREKFEEARIAEAEKIGDVSIVDYAATPKFPIKPMKKVGAILGMIVGLMVGLLSAFVVESMDTSIGTIEDVESLLKLPVLGVVPHVSAEGERPSPWWKIGLFESRPTSLDEIKIRLIVHTQSKSPIAEAYRTLRTNLKLADSGRKVILVTSAGPREGKTTVMVNLALTAAQMGNRTLIVSTDMRRPALYKTFGIKSEPGLNEVLSGTVKWENALRSLPDLLVGEMDFDEAMKTPGLDNLSIITSGHIPINPSELLGSKEMISLIEKLKAKFDVILFDSPPILPITDAAILAPKLDGTIIVYEIGRTARGALLRAKNQLESAGAKVFGVVLNHIRPETEMYPTYYPHYYRYRYYGTEKKKG